MTSGAEAWLVDDRWGKAYPISEDTTIGRGSASAIILRDPAVSRHHATVRRRGVEYVLDVATDAGTSLNGAAVTGETVLQEGDVIDIALTSLRFTQRAPTGEMFIVSRDYPALGREGPTRPTLHAMHPITLVSRSVGRVRAYWHLLLVIMLTITVLALCADLAR
jgi:hypothetical protein